ncbi:RcnB family protein [Sphingobium rhizovicinum]|uniref:RcnB family protein n=1 Tax=Sphingobium rhizovicinum TaxID=432308 RepID=A0ABV7NCK5_9SPHN
MLRKMVLAGLMGATLLSGIAPAYAQAGQERGGQERGDRGGREDRAARPQGNMAWSRGNRMTQPQGDNQNRGQSWQRRDDAGAQQRWQQRPTGQPGNAQPAGQMAPPRPDARWRGDPSLPANREVERQVRERREREQQQNWRNDQRNDRPDWRNDRRGDDRRDWNGNRDWNRDRDRNDGRWNNDNRNGGWNNGNWNNGRRYDDRTRWSNQRRWDNGWRQDRRYDWYSYRSRYGDQYRMGRYYAPRGWDYGYRRFSVGIFLNSLLYSNSYWLDDPYSYRLPPAYGSLRWIRYYDDALLVDVRDGYVVDVINNFFW